MKVLLFLPKAFEHMETGVFIDVLGWARVVHGHDIQLVTAGYTRQVNSTFDVHVVVDKLIDEITCDDCDALAMPGGFSRFGFFEEANDARLQNLIREFHAKGKILATICVAAIALGEAGILRGRRATTYHLDGGEKQRQLREYGANVVNERIVVDVFRKRTEEEPAMSAIQPPYEVPYPIIDDAERLDEERAVEGVTATTPARPVEAEVEKPDIPPAADEILLSLEARDLIRNALAAPRARGLSPGAYTSVSEIDYLIAREARDTAALRELLAGFQNYDNGEARAAFNNRLATSAAYGGAYAAAAREEEAVAGQRASDNALYRGLGIINRATATKIERAEMARSIDRWLAGEGVFSPEMLYYPSSDGFRFAPLSQSAQASLRSADILATYERFRILAYLREMAELAPNDFLFYDPTGLVALALEQRREFLTRVDELLVQAGIEERAAELRYDTSGSGSGTIGVEAPAADEAEQERIRQVVDQINSYYGQLESSVSQYDSGVISESMA